ncbi:hypothetical protein NMY22_g19035 [Coprinellus aureogranulatus]|nr:hypothetical protein NMY22_g19035 [Coprinellus aureogranulatus]
MAFGLIESYNRTRYVEELLYKTDGQPPSFTVHLHPEYWILNNGSKFLYHNQIASLLDDIRAHRIPVDFLELFDSARVPFYEGCMVVELLDYRSQQFNQPQPEKPERTRVILHPNPETLYADICSMNMKNGGTWTDRDALEVESKLLLATSPPLCLDPNAHLTRVANHVLRASTPTVPVSLKRKAATLDPEEEESERARRNAMMGRFRGRSDDRISTPSFSILDTLYKFRKAKEAEAQSTLPPSYYLLGPPPRPPVVTTSPTPANGVIKDAGAPHPPQPSIQFVSQQPPTATIVTPAMQPRVYANVQAATEAAAASHRAPTPQTTQAQQIQQQQHQHQLQLLQKAQQQQQQTMQPNPKVAQPLPQASQNDPRRPTPAPKPNATPAPIQPAASSSGGPYQNQYIMQVAQQPSQQSQPGAPPRSSSTSWAEWLNKPRLNLTISR